MRRHTFVFLASYLLYSIIFIGTIKAQSYYQLRLVGGANPWEGRLEVYYNGRWGTFCDDEFDDFDAEVACWDLGYSGQSSYRTCSNSEKASSETTIWLDEVACSGDDYRIQDCGHRGWGSYSCSSSHTEDVCLTCQSTRPNNGDLRLVGGNNDWEGRLEVYYGERWGTICDDYFSADEANVACWQIGFAGYSSERTANSNERAMQHYKIWLDGLDCSGDELSLGDCSHYSWGSIHSYYCNYYHNEDVYLICSSTRDNMAPPDVSGCPTDVTVYTELGTIGTTAIWTEPSATDASTFSTVRSHDPGNFFPIGETHVAYIYTDRGGYTAACSFSVIVDTVDTTLPTIENCTSDTYNTTELGTNGTSVSWTEPIATDLSNLTVIRSHEPWSIFPLGITEVKYFFVDTSNNTVNCSFTVTVETVDTTSPSVSHCPSDFSSVAGRHVTWIEPTAFDLSENITIIKTHSPGSFLVEDMRVGYNFTDPSGNTGHCHFVISTFEDNTSPVINGCPDDIHTVFETGSVASPVYWNQPSATDDNGRVTLRKASHIPGANFPAGESYVQYIFTDDSYNFAFCNFSVIVSEVDTKPPEVSSCPSEISLDIEPGKVSITVYWDTPTAYDVSGNVSLLSHSHNSGDMFTSGRTRVSYTFADETGNIAVCSFSVNLYTLYFGNVTYEDNIPPVIINCPVDIIISAELGTTEIPVFWSAPSAVDEQGFVTDIDASHKPGDRFPVDSTTRVLYQFMDGSLNFATCNFSIFVEAVDTTPPTIEYCPDDITETVELGVSTVQSVSWIEPVVSDLSGNVSLSDQSRIPSKFSTVRETEVVYIYMDNSGNQITCRFFVSFLTVDSTPPTIISCPTNTSVSTELGTDKTEVSWSSPVATDASGIVTVNSTHIPGDTFPVGLTNVNYNFYDGSDNYAECDFYVFVETVDTTQPTLVSCPKDIATSIEYGNDRTPVFWNEPSATDLSGNVSVSSQSHASGDDFTVGMTDVRYILSDDSGNSIMCEFSVEVRFVDTQKPVIHNCPSNINVDIEVPNNNAPASWIEPSAIDQSGNVTLLVKTHSPGNNFGIGKTSVTYLYADSSNNMESCVFSITGRRKEDQTPPTIMNCPPSEINTVIEGDPKLGTNVIWTEPSGVDESGNVTLLVNTHSPGQVFRAGSTSVMYLFADTSNNIASCIFDVIVEPAIKPPDVLNCPPDIHVSLELGEPSIPVSWIEPLALDGSGLVSITYRSHLPGQRFNVNKTSVSYMFGNDGQQQVNCDFSVIVSQVDTTPPELTFCPSDIIKTVETGTQNIVVSWDDPLVGDKSGVVKVTAATHAPGDEFDVGSTRVSYTFADGANNIVSCKFSVTVTEVDTIAPTILSCPVDSTAHVDPGNLGTSVSWKEPTAEDASGSPMLLVQTHKPGTFFAVGTTIVSYIYRDKASNMNKCSFSVTVLAVNKTSPGVFNCPTNIITTADSGKNETAVTWEEPFAVNLSPSANVASSHSSNATFPIGSTKVVYTFEDVDGFKEYCNFTVVIVQNARTPSALNNRYASSGSFDDSGIMSSTALALCLLIIVVGIIVFILIACIRKRSKANDLKIEGLQLSASSSLKSLNL